MTQPQEHEPTPQEQELYEAMTAGDWDTSAVIDVAPSFIAAGVQR